MAKSYETLFHLFWFQYGKTKVFITENLLLSQNIEIIPINNDAVISTWVSIQLKNEATY